MAGTDTQPAAQAGWRRSRLLRTVPLILAVAGAAWLLTTGPQKTTLSIQLEGRRDGLLGLQVELFEVPGRRLARHFEYFYSASSPPPPSQTRETKLSKGEYTAEITLRYSGRSEQLERSFRFGGEEWVELRL